MTAHRESWPLYYSDTIHLSNPESTTGIICLWTKKERIIEKLDEDKYAFIGQLYSKEYGLEILLRNLLANNSLRDLVVTGIDLNDVAPGLINFFKYDVENGAIHGTNIVLSESIQQHIQTIKQRVELHDWRTSNNFHLINDKLEALPPKEPFGPEIEIDLPEIISPTRYPTDYSGFSIKEPRFTEAWRTLKRHILKFGEYDGETEKLSVHNVQITIQNITDKDRRLLLEPQRIPVATTYNAHGKTHITITLDSLGAWEELRRILPALPQQERIHVFAKTVYLAEENIESAIESLNKPRHSRKPDPHGNILLRVENQAITVLHMDQEGKVLDEDSFTDKKEIFKYLTEELKVSRIDHALDIGAEIQKATVALRTGAEYSQDKPIRFQQDL